LYTPNGCYIDLDLPLPITADELFDEVDFEFINCKHPEQHNLFFEAFSTTNIFWNLPQGGPTPDGTLGYITNPEIVQRLTEYYHLHFAIDILNWHPASNGPTISPFSVVKFSESSQYHKEGASANRHHIDSDEYKSTFFTRFPYCVNFKLIGNVEDSSVHFGEPSDDLVQEEKFLEKKLLNNTKRRLETHRHPENYIGGARRRQAKSKKYDFGVFYGRTGFHSDIEEQELLTTKVERKGNYQPFIINVEEWHKVLLHTQDEARVTLRFMGSERYKFNELEELQKNKKLLAKTK